MDRAVEVAFDRVLIGEDVPHAGKYAATALLAELMVLGKGQPVAAEQAAKFFDEFAKRLRTAAFLILREHAGQGRQLSDVGFNLLLELQSSQEISTLAL